MLTFPFSLFLFLFQGLFGWLGTAHLVSRRRLIKLGVFIAVTWLALGQLTMLFDGDSEIASNQPSITQSWPFIPATTTTQASFRYPINWTCEDVIKQEADIAFGDWPLGKPFMFLTGCSAQLGASMLRSVGLTHLSNRWGRLADQAWRDWLFHGRLGIAYFLLGIGAYAEIVLTLPWLVYLVVRTLVSHLRWA